MTYPTIRPELTLDFANSRQLDPRITFSRSSSATYLNPDTGLITTASDHEARFEKEGLLIEGSRTNYIDESVDLTDTGTWGNYKFETPTLNAGIAPDGTNTAASLIPNTENTSRTYWCRNISTTFSGTLTVSVFAKANGYNNFQLGIDHSSAGGAFGGGAIFDLSTGIVTQGTSGTGKIQSFANGWYRCSVTHTNTAQAFTVTPNVQGRSNSGDSVFTGDGTSGYLLWGFQLEEGSFLTSLIPTSGSTVTRSPDSAQITGDNFSSWYNQGEGTLAVTANTYDNNYTTLPLAFIHQDGNNSYQFSYRSQTTYFPRVSAGNYTITVDSSADSRDNCKIAGVYGPNSSGNFTAAVGVNGSSFERASPLVPNVIAATNLKIGSNHGNTLYANTTIARLSYYPRRLTDSELQTITL